LLLGTVSATLAAPPEEHLAAAVTTVARADDFALFDLPPNPIAPIQRENRGLYVSVVAVACSASPLIPTDPCQFQFGAT
jgi:hypothetical protein